MNDAGNGHEWTSPDGSVPTSGPMGPAEAVPTAAGYSAPASGVPGAPVVVQAAPAQTHIPTFRSWQPGIIPLRPVSFGEFISVPFRAMRYNRAVVLGGPLLVVAVAMILLAAAMWLAFTDPSLALLSPVDQFRGIQAQTVIVAAAAFVALILADALASAVVAPGVARAVLGEKIPLGEALRGIGPRVWSLLLLWFLSTLALVLAMVPGGIAVWAGVAAQDDGAITIGVLAMIALALVVGLPVYIISAVARCVIVLERTGAVTSIKRTIGLIRGRFWWSVLIVFVTGLIVYFATGIFQQVLGFVGGIALVIGVSGAWVGTAIFVLVTVVGAVIAYVITYAYMGSVYALVYIDARIRHEGFDLDLARAAEARRT